MCGVECGDFAASPVRGRLLFPELANQFAKLGSNPADCRGCRIQPLLSLLAGKGQGALLLGLGARSSIECLSSTCQCVALVMYQLLDP